MNSYSREILHSYSSENEYHGCSTSPSDLSPSPEAIKRSNSSPIQSDLPTLFSNLRTNEKTKNGSSSESTSRSLFKKFLSLGKSDERDDQPQLNQQLTHGIFNPFKSRSKSHDDTPSNNSSESLLSYRHVTIPPIFLKDGMPLLKVSNKSKKRILFKIDPDNFMVSWNKPTTHRLLTPTKSNSNSQAMAPVASISNSVADGFITGTSVNLENDSPLSTSKKYHREVSIDDIKNMLYQEDASNYREELHISKEHEHNWLTLFYFNTKKQKLKTFHVIADSEHDFKRLVTVLLDLKRLKGDFARNFLLDLDGTDEESIRRSMILEGGKQLKQFLSFYDILKYCKRLNINVSSSYLRKIFTEVAPEGSTLDFEQFKEFVSILKYRDDISNIYDANLDGEKRMTYSNFRIFLKKVQLDSFTDDQIMKLYNNFSGGGENGGDYITIDGFNNFLNSKYNNPIKFKVDDSYFEKPFNEYFISSSHNTYLMGRQIAGDSSIEGYIKALQKGCRCVEIDVWDGEMPGEVSTGITSDQVNENNQCVLNIVVELEPTVSHGRTFTTTISFLNVVKTIKKYAFIASPYPVIISLETHCNIDNQRKMVSTLKEILGEALVLDPIDDFFGLLHPSS